MSNALSSSGTDRFFGYRRPDGRVGVRNHVAVISVMDNANPIVRRICANVRGCVPVCPSHGRGEIGDDLAQHLRTLAGLAANPNVYGAILIGLEPTMPREVAHLALASGKPMETLSVDETGSSTAVMMEGIRLAQRMVIAASDLRREEAAMSELVLGVECGGSDTTSGVVGNPTVGLVADRVVAAGGTVILSETPEWMGAEKSLISRAVTPELGQRIAGAIQWYEDYAKSIGIDISEGNPAPDNKAGGLTTIEEKSLGAVKKAGSSPVRGLMRYAETPPARGLVLMDASSPGTENITGVSAAGAQLIIFNTGKGNPIAAPLTPTIKVTGNPRTAKRAAENLDVDLSAVVSGALSLGDAGRMLYERMLAHASGRLTVAEVLGDEETAFMRIGFSL